MRRRWSCVWYRSPLLLSRLIREDRVEMSLNVSILPETLPTHTRCSSFHESSRQDPIFPFLRFLQLNRLMLIYTLGVCWSRDWACGDGVVDPRDFGRQQSFSSPLLLQTILLLSISLLSQDSFFELVHTLLLLLGNLFQGERALFQRRDFL